MLTGCQLLSFAYFTVHSKFPIINKGPMTHIDVSKLTIIGSDSGSSPGRRQVIIWTNTGILMIEPLGTNFSEILIEIWKRRLENGGLLSRPQCYNCPNTVCRSHRTAKEHKQTQKAWWIVIVYLILSHIPEPIFIKKKPSYRYSESHYKSETVNKPC